MNTIKVLQTILKEKFRIEVDEKYFLKDISIGPTGIGLDAIGMFYFIYFIENEFNIKFTREHFKSGVIRSLSGLYEAINELHEKALLTDFSDLGVN